jgi:hypothetical protein
MPTPIPYDKINQLEDGQIVKYRVGYYSNGHYEPIWSQWHTGPLMVYRHNGKILSLAPKNHLVAEFRPEEFGFGSFCCEDQYLEIDGIS